MARIATKNFLGFETYKDITMHVVIFTGLLENLKEMFPHSLLIVDEDHDCMEFFIKIP